MLRKIVILNNGMDKLTIAAYNKNDNLEYLLEENKLGLKVESIYTAKINNINYKSNTAFVDFGNGIGFINIPKENKMQEGCIVCCQIKHLAQNMKQTKLSLQINYIGRYVILTNDKTHRFYCEDNKISDLQKVVAKYNEIGIIFRTNINEASDLSLIDIEIAQLVEKKNYVDSLKLNKSSVGCIFNGIPLYLRLIRDCQFTDDFQIITNDDDIFNQISKYVDLWQIDKLHFDKICMVNLNLDDLYQPIVQKDNFNLEINTVSGINLIDINSSNAKLSFYQINYLALDEIVKQIKLRDLTGIILLDLIKNMSKNEQQQILERISVLMKNDWRNSRIYGFSKAEVFEIIRNK